MATGEDDGGVDIPIEVDLTGGEALDDLRAKLGNLNENIDRLTAAMGQNATASNATAATFNRLAKDQDSTTAAGARFLANLKVQVETLGLTGAALAAAKAGYYGVGDEAQAAVAKMEAFEAQRAAAREAAAAEALAIKELSAQIKELEASEAAEAATKARILAQQEAARAEINATASQAAFNDLLGVGGGAGGNARASAEVFQQALAQEEAYAAQVAALKDKINPAAAAQRQLGEATAFADKALADGLVTEAEHTAALKLAQKAADDAARAMNGLSHGTAGVTREMLVIMRELSRGNFSRVAGSLTILVDRVGLLGVLLNPVTLGVIALTAAVGALIYNINQGAEEQNQFNNALKATGDAAGVSEGALYTMGDTVAASVHKSAEEVRGLELSVVRLGKVSGDNIGKMAADAELLATAMGEKPAAALKTLEGLTGDVAKKSAELNEQLHFLTEAQWLHIQALEEAGHQDQALSAALDALNDHLKNTTAEVGWLDGAFKALKDHTDAFIASIRELGRDQTAEEKLAKLKELLANPAEQAAIVAHGGSVDTAAINEQIASLQRVVDIQKTLSGWVAENNKAQQQSIADDQADGKKNDELSDALARRTRETAALTEAKRQLTAATSAQARADTQAVVTAKEDDLQNNANTIKRLRKQIAGPKGPKGPADASPLEMAKNALDKQLAAMDQASKADLLQAEVDFWAAREAKIDQGTKAGHKLYIDEDNARVAAQRQLNAVLLAEQQKAAREQQQLDDLRAHDKAELARKAAQFERNGELGDIDDRITRLRAQMRAEGGLRQDDLDQLREYYRQRVDIIRRGAQAELEAKLSDAISEKHNAENDPALSEDQRAIAVERANQHILIAQQAYNQAVQAGSQNADKQMLQATLETVNQQVSAYRNAANRIADTWRTAFEDMLLHTRTWAQVVQSVERGLLDASLRGIQRMVVDHAAAERQKVLVSKMSAEQKAAYERTAANESGVLNFKQTLIQINNDALKAYSGVTAATAPYLGPFAPVAGAAAYATILGLEGSAALFSAAGGFDIPKGVNPIVQAHAEEMILPAKFANPLRDMLTGRGGTSNSSTTNNRGGDTHHWHISQQAGESADDLAKRIIALHDKSKLRREMFA